MRIDVRDAGDLKRLNRQLGEVAGGRELRKELRTGLRDVLRPVAAEVKAAYRARAGRRRRGQRRALHRLLAGVVRVEVRTSGRLAGARIRVDGRKMPDQMKSLPAYVEGYKPRWRHPVFGDRDVWVAQAADPLFDRTVEPHEPAATRAVDKVLADVRDKLERSR